jgi:hypothetical protein
MIIKLFNQGKLLLSWGGFTGVTHKINNYWILSLLYNYVKVERITFVAYNIVTFNLSYYLMQNLIFIFEVTEDIQE